MSKEKPSVVKLKDLVQSPRNVRTIEVPLGGLPSSILANGIYMPLLVTEVKAKGKATAKYAVEAGERRRKALISLLDSKLITEDYEVKVSVIDEADAINASLVENFQRAQMHPYDEFIAFKALADQNQSIEHISNVFGIGELHVKRRLKLANASPQILEVFKSGEMTLEQLMALCLTDDQERQWQVWNNATQSWEKGASRLRDAITTNEIAVTNKKVLFIGVENYLAAGGKLRQDLFTEEGKGDTVLDITLLDKMVQDKLSELADQVQGEGWGWVEFAEDFDYEYINKFQRLYETNRELTEEEQVKIDALKVREEALDVAEELYQNEDEEDEAKAEEFDKLRNAIDAEENAIIEATKEWPETKNIAGVFLCINSKGELERREGLLRASDAKVIRAEENAANGIESGNAAEENELSQSLKQCLMAHRTGGLQIHIANSPDKALVILAHKMVLQSFSQYRQVYDASVMNITINETNLYTPIADFDESEIALGLENIKTKWLDLLPKKQDELLDWLFSQTQETLLSLLAYCTSRSVDVTFESKNDQYKKIGALFELDMRNWWKPTANNYFKRVSKDEMLEVVKKTGNSINVDINKMKKGDLAEKVAETIAQSGWLPDLLEI